MAYFDLYLTGSVSIVPTAVHIEELAREDKCQVNAKSNKVVFWPFKFYYQEFVFRYSSKRGILLLFRLGVRIKTQSEFRKWLETYNAQCVVQVPSLRK